VARGFGPVPGFTIAILGLINGLVNITSIILEAQLDGDPILFVEPLHPGGLELSLLWRHLAAVYRTGGPAAAAGIPANLPGSILWPPALDRAGVAWRPVAGIVIIE